MIKKSISVIVVLILILSVFSGAVVSEPAAYAVKCTCLKNPDAIKAAADKTAKFWEKAYDSKYGGFYTYIGRDGSIDKGKTYKVALIQSRDAYAFVRAYQLTGRKEYLQFARKGLDFMYKNAWDKVNTGWYQEMNRDGSIAAAPLEGVDWNSMKWSFNQFYALCGISAMYDATRSKTDEAWLVKSYSSLDKKLWDSRPGFEGYFDMASRNFGNAGGKGVGIMDAITTHAETMSLISSDAKYRKRFLAVADCLSGRLVKSMDGRSFGFNESYDSDWKAVKQPDSTTSGNILKPAWCLARAYLVDPKPEYKAGAEKLTDEILSSGAYDNVNGGPYTTLDPASGKTTDKRKSWWIQEQGVTSGITGYYISGDPDCLKMADESLDFFMKHMYDTQYGDAFGDTAANGSDPVTAKGTYWKDAYHTMELFYYTYLYGNLMLHNKPVTLYYSIDSGTKARDIILKPVALGKNKLVISGVTLNGKAYKGFDGSKCLLKLPAGTGGEFKVTFKPVAAK